MDLATLQQQATTSIDKFEAKAGAKDHDEMLFMYMSKISEDIGNLASSVLSREGINEAISDNSVNGAFAESLYSIVMLAQKMKVDLPGAVQQKIESADIDEEPLL